MKKLANIITLVADLTPGVGLVVFGVAVIVAAQTGVLWH
jgi:hypothetical protein